MKCCNCKGNMIWQNDHMCDEVYGCPCGKGITSIWYCSDCEILGELTTDCDVENGEVFFNGEN